MREEACSPLRTKAAQKAHTCEPLGTAFQSPAGDSLHCHCHPTETPTPTPTPMAPPPTPSFNPPKGILFIVTFPFPSKRQKSASFFPFLAIKLHFCPPNGRKWPPNAFPSMSPHPKNPGVIGFLASPLPLPCRFGRSHPPPVGALRAEIPSIAETALTPRHARILAPALRARRQPAWKPPQRRGNRHHPPSDRTGAPPGFGRH